MLVRDAIRRLREIPPDARLYCRGRDGKLAPVAEIEWSDRRPTLRVYVGAGSNTVSAFVLRYPKAQALAAKGGES